MTPATAAPSSRGRATSRRAAVVASAPDAEQLRIEIPEAAHALQIQYIPRKFIHPDREQPRQDADAELRASIALNGLLQPVTVRPHPERIAEFMIVDGERRWRGSEGVLEQLPCIVREDQDNDVRRLVTQVVANRGKELAPIEEARAYRAYIEHTGATQVEVAEAFGEPKSKISERLALFEIGPWLELLTAGEITISQAVRVLLPLRSVPDEFHAKAIETIKKDYRWGKRGGVAGGAGISTGDFQSLVTQTYRSYFYPLAKSSSPYAKQPEFNTKGHATECSCGGIKFDIGYGAERLCCGNPGWWKPRHRKALAEKKKDEPKKAAPKPELYFPAGTPVLNLGYGEPPKGVIALTDEQKRWNVSQHFLDRAFDPADLNVEALEIVECRPSYGAPKVGTRSAVAVKQAQDAWRVRWEARSAQLRAELDAAIAPHLENFRVQGEGTRKLLEAIVRQGARHLVDLAEIFDIELTDDVRKAQRHQLEGKVAKWVGALELPRVEFLASAYATAAGRNLKLTSERLVDEQVRAIDEIRKRPVPWAKAPKKGKAAPGKAAAKAVVEEDAADSEDAEDDAEDQQRMCVECGCADDDACPGGCSWVAEATSEYGELVGVCSACASTKDEARDFLLGGGIRGAIAFPDHVANALEEEEEEGAEDLRDADDEDQDEDGDDE